MHAEIDNVINNNTNPAKKPETKSMTPLDEVAESSLAIVDINRGSCALDVAGADNKLIVNGRKLFKKPYLNIH